MKVEDGFQIKPFPEGHPYTEDPVLPNLLRRLVPQDYVREIEADLIRFGNDVKNDIRPNISPLVGNPRLIQYDQWGRRIDYLETSEGWRKLKDIAIREGVVAIAHERKYGEYARVYGFMKAAIFAPDSHMVMCPMAMTDGAARVLELYGTDEMKRNLRSRLISRDPSFAITSGQWMTERPGGSDVSQTETIATRKGAVLSFPSVGAEYVLDGFKWFSSATDAEVSVALARTGIPSDGARGLSLFLVPLRLPLFPIRSAPATSNGILVHRLKNKFGTQTLPTAELSLDHTEAYLLSPLNQGIRCIAPVLNITRVHSALGVVSALSRAFAIARSYATVRTINVPNTNVMSGQRTGTHVLLQDVPLHTATLARIGVTYQALANLVFSVVALLGKSECGVASESEEQRLRVLTPVLKGFVSERGVPALEECMNCLGGQGYMEENVIPGLIRDISVERIWEGTISVMALDMVRAATGKLGIKVLIDWAYTIIRSGHPSFPSHATYQSSINSITTALSLIQSIFSTPASLHSPYVQRPLLFLVGHTVAAVVLLEHAIWAHSTNNADCARELTVFIRWVEDAGLDYAVKDVEKARRLEDLKARKGEDASIIYGTTNGTKLAKL